MNSTGEAVIGIGWYIPDEYFESLLSAKTILIEGFFALNNVTNTYGMALKLRKNNDIYEMEYANTYKRKRRENINNLFH